MSATSQMHSIHIRNGICFCNVWQRHKISLGWRGTRIGPCSVNVDQDGHKMDYQALHHVFHQTRKRRRGKKKKVTKTSNSTFFLFKWGIQQNTPLVKYYIVGVFAGSWKTNISPSVNTNLLVIRALKSKRVLVGGILFTAKKKKKSFKTHCSQMS